MRRRAVSALAALVAALAVVGAAVAAVPGAPGSVVAIPGDARATLHLTPPISDGGFAITSYTVTASPGGFSATAAAWPIIVTGLANGTSYTFTARATNASGIGPASAASNPVTPVLPTIAPAVSITESFAAALDAHGQVYAWGADTDGQLGQGRPIIRASPVKVDGLPIITRISILEHVLALDANGQVWSWGESCGGLGPRDGTSTGRPSRVIGATGMSRIAAGSCKSLGIKGGAVWEWDKDGMRQTAFPAGMTEIFSGGSHVLALRASDGKVFASGLNTFGELGQGHTNPVPGVVEVPLPAAAIAIAAGSESSLALLSNGEMRFWGRYSVSLPGATSPTLVTGLGGTAVSITTSNFSFAAVRADGTVWRWINSLTSPVQVTGIAGAAQVEYRRNQQTLFAITAGGALFAEGQNNNGQLGQGHTNPVVGGIAVPGFASGTSQVRVAAISAAVVALKTDGTVWFWGANESGQRGDGAPIGSSVPLAVPIPATLKAVAAGHRFGIALDTTGQVWGWGENGSGQLGTSKVSRSTAGLVPGISNVAGIAAGGFGNVVYARTDKTAWYASTPNGAIVQAAGLANIVGVAASANTRFFVREDGAVFSLGSNAEGELGNGTMVSGTSTPVQVVGISGVVTKVAAAWYRVVALTSDGRVYTWGSHQTGASLTGDTNIPVLVPGITDAVDIAAGTGGGLARRANGSVVAWGSAGLAEGSSYTVVPFPVTFHEPVRAMAIGGIQGFLVGNSGLVWGWGRFGVNSVSANVGDGALITRDRPVVVLSHGGNGRLDAGNWYLDLMPATLETVPPGSIPKAIAVASFQGTVDALALQGTIRYRGADLGKRVNNYVLGLVPPAFFDLVKTAPGLSDPERLRAKAAKANGFVLANLTPEGWLDSGQQLFAFSNGVANPAGAAAAILNGIKASLAAGAKFCVGYGESPSAMLIAQSLVEVMVLEGATTAVADVPCVIGGIYLSGPPSSVQASPVTFAASIVGVNPGGVVEFKRQTGGSHLDLAPSTLVAAANPAVSTASVTTSSLALGTHSIVATYSGDALNPPAITEVPKLHVVKAQVGVTLEGPSSSPLGSEVAFTATVAGNVPTNSVQFFDGSTALGAPAPVVQGTATLRTTALALGNHAITAQYPGDGQNTSATSAARGHVVVAVLATRVTLASSANPAPPGAAVTLTVTVSGSSSSPSGNVTLRDDGNPLGTTALAGGAASFVLAALAPGQHRLTVDYAGDGGANPAATSETLLQQVEGPPLLVVATVSRTGLGNGTVTSGPAGIVCGLVCASEFLMGSDVTLTAVPAAGSTFVEWTQGCSGSGTCTLAMSAPRVAQARFEPTGTGVAIEPTTLAFGGQSINTSSPARTVTLTNNSGAAIAVDTVTPPAGFSATHNCSSVGNGASCTVTVTFTPVAQGGTAANVTLSYPQGGTTRVTVIPVTGAGERSLVTHYYQSILGRAPDAGGKQHWENETARVAGLGASVNEVWFALAQEFYFSGEYRAFNRDNAGYVTDLYRTFFNRAPDSGGFTSWVGQLDAGLPREVLLASFMFSPEFASFTQAIFGSTSARAEVNMVVDFYRGMLLRLPDSAGFAGLVGKFRAAQCLNSAAAVIAEVESISAQFAQSAEYLAKARTTPQYVGDLYNAFLRRGGDLGGVQYWIDQIGTGARNRDEVRIEFKKSLEFQQRVGAVVSQGCLNP